MKVLQRFSTALLGAVFPRILERKVALRFATPRPRRRDTTGDFSSLSYAHVLGSSSDPQEMAVWVRGQGPSILLVHGWEGTHMDMGPIAAELVARGFRVVIPDLPAHGSSRGRCAPITLLAHSIKVLAEAHGPFVGCVAHSLGGAAVVLAMKDGFNPERAVFLGCPSRAEDYLRSQMRRAYVDERHYAGAAESYRQMFGADVNSLDVAADAQALRIPALFIHDADDRRVPISDARRNAAAWPQSRLLALRGFGHRGILKSPEAIQTTGRFLSASAILAAIS